jgi:thioredoxin reductase (NADPH)
MAVIGAGPAGIASVIQLSRSGHDVTVYEKGRVGGTLWNAHLVDNYPGFPGGITGRRLAAQMERQLLEHVAGIVRREVKRVSLQEHGFLVDGDYCDGVILCTGTDPKKAGFPGEEELASAGLLHYGIAETEDWPEGTEACVIGGGEASMDMAVSLCQAGMKVTLLHRSEPVGIPSLLETAMSQEKIEWRRGEVKNARSGKEKAVLDMEERELAFDQVVVAVGREAIVPELIGFNLEHPTAGFLVAGDAVRGGLGQTAMAVGDGIEMAMKLDRLLEANR